MICPCGSETCNCHKTISTQTCHCHLCSGLNQETCEICGLQIPSVCLANDEVLVGEDVQPNTCECFFSTNTAMDSSEETDICGNKTEPTRKRDTPEDVSEIQTMNSKRSEGCLSQLEENANTIFEKQDVKNGVESTPDFSYSSDGYVLTPDEQSDGNIINDQEMSSGSGEDPNSATERKELSAQNLNEIEKRASQNELAKETTCEHREHSADESVNKPKIIDSNNNPETVNKICSDKNKHKAISTGTKPFCTETSTIRPLLPRPFPRHSRPVMPAPKIPISIPGRFSNLPRIRMNIGVSQHAEGQQAQTGGSPSLSKVQLNRSQKLDPEISPAKKSEIIESWLNEVERSPPDEPSTAAETSAEGHEQADDLELSGISSDSKSSTELSEEENRRQRLSRRPPRTRKKSKK